MKPCKGNYRVNHFEGCGEESQVRTYGLCPKCLGRWAFSTEEGKEWMSKKVIPKAKKKVETEKKKKTRKQKEEYKSIGRHVKELQDEVNKAARLIDENYGCISCTHGHNSSFTMQAHGSHRWNTREYGGVRLNLHNIHKSCSRCNNQLSGNPDGYNEGLFLRYDESYREFVLGLSVEGKRERLGLMKFEIIELKAKIRKFIREIEKENIDVSDSIKIRNELNEILGQQKYEA